MPILQTLLAGLVGTALMTGLMTFIHVRGWANADMIRALGSLATRSMRGSVRAGIVIHLASGLLFAFPYAILLSVFVPDAGTTATLLAGVVGLFHGIVVSLLLIAVVSERHPVKKFQGAGVSVALAHLAGHVGYGLGIGAVVAIADIQWSVLA